MIEVSKTHPLGHMNHSFGITPYLLHLMLYLGQKEVFQEGQHSFKTLLQLSVSSSQIQRVCEQFGQGASIESILEEPIPVDQSVSKPSTLYAQVDGSYIMTDQDWKEVKLGRIFSSDAIKVQTSEFEGVAPRTTIESSDYLAYKGDHVEFTRRFDKLMNKRIDQTYKATIFITDGEVWIDNWLQRNYQHHTCILDYYHATKRLRDVANSAFRNEQKREEWVEQQKDLLLQSKVEKILEHVDAIKDRTKAIQEKKQSIRRYYQDNQHRMDYKYYLQQGWFIGSGAIESAHRNVIQQRMKLSGQRWGTRAQAILNLRAVNKSSKWSNLIQMINDQSCKMAA